MTTGATRVRWGADGGGGGVCACVRGGADDGGVWASAVIGNVKRAVSKTCLILMFFPPIWDYEDHPPDQRPN
jgi:hypothetical protein